MHEIGSGSLAESSWFGISQLAFKLRRMRFEYTNQFGNEVLLSQIFYDAGGDSALSVWIIRRKKSIIIGTSIIDKTCRPSQLVDEQIEVEYNAICVHELIQNMHKISHCGQAVAEVGDV